ncbi:glycosyltransferase [Benzoatithermus flavus]|uniref:Glycosyltransferase n=1 Tax=Benzoatithermus flavus TaxID=3108223 RepID=A0ABU8XNN2_9PROT
MALPMHVDPALVLTALAVLAGMAGLHPFLTYPLSLVLLRPLVAAGRRPSPRAADAVDPSVAIVCCAHNEERSLPAKLANLRALQARHPELSVHLYSDGSTDRTNEILREQAEGFRVVIGAERQGKSVGMNRLMAEVTSDLVLFTDANIELDLGAVANVKRYFADPDVGCVCGHLVHTLATDRGSPVAISRYWRLEQAIKRLETALGTTIAADGGLFAIRRALFRPVPPDIIDDMFTSVSILCDGYRLVQAPDVVGDEEPQASPGAEMQRKRRIACRCFRCHRLLWPRLRRLPWLRLYMYLSHKLLRWFSGALLVSAVFLMLLAFALLAPIVTIVALLSAAGGAGLAHVLARRHYETGKAVLAALLSPSLGVLDAVQGKTYTVWTPVRGYS